MSERLNRLAEVARAAELAPLARLAAQRTALREALGRRAAALAALEAERGDVDMGSAGAWAAAERWRNAQRRRLQDASAEIDRLEAAAAQARSQAARALGRRRALEALAARAAAQAQALRRRRRETDGEPG